MPSGGSTAFAEAELSPDHAEVELAELIDDVIPTRGYQMLPMVGTRRLSGQHSGAANFFPCDAG